MSFAQYMGVDAAATLEMLAERCFRKRGPADPLGLHYQQRARELRGQHEPVKPEPLPKMRRDFFDDAREDS